MKPGRGGIPERLATFLLEALVALAPLAPPLALVLLAVAYRAPMLASAAGATNSDSAVVGLQALHFSEKRDLTSAFLWGSHYQTAVDSVLAAAAFLVFGVSPRVLMAASLVAYLVLVLSVYATLAHDALGIGRTRAALVSLLLVFAGAPVHGYALFPPRQVALTLVFASFLAAEHAGARARRRAFAGAGGRSGRDVEGRAEPSPAPLAALAGALAALSVFADPYALVLVPVLAIRTLGSGRRALAGTVVGGLLGALPFAWLTTRAAASHGTFGFSLATVGHNLALLRYPCLPWALGAIDFTPEHFLRWVPWEPALPFRLLAAGGAAVALVALGGAAWQLVVPTLRRSRARRPFVPLAVAAWVGMVLTLVAFSTSVMVMDLFSTRYLVALVLLIPFALAPLAARLSAPRLALVLALPVFAGVASGIAGYGPFVREIDEGARESALERFLDARDVHDAYADYWVSYRLTFLTGERLVVVPTNPAEDRWPPYRDRVRRAPAVAYVWDPARSRDDADVIEAGLRADGVAFERSDVAGYRVIVTHDEDARRLARKFEAVAFR